MGSPRSGSATTLILLAIVALTLTLTLGLDSGPSKPTVTRRVETSHIEHISLPSKSYVETKTVSTFSSVMEE